MAEARKGRMISLALDADLLAQLAQVMSACNYTNRSRAVRDALKLLVAEKCDPRRLRGAVRGTVTLLCEPGLDLCPLIRGHEGVVRSRLEAERDGKGALHVLVVAGDAARVVALVDALGNAKGVSGMKVGLF